MKFKNVLNCSVCSVHGLLAMQTGGTREHHKLCTRITETSGKLVEGKKFFGGETMGRLPRVVLDSLPNWLRFLEESEGIKVLSQRSSHYFMNGYIGSLIPIIKECIP